MKRIKNFIQRRIRGFGDLDLKNGDKFLAKFIHDFLVKKAQTIQVPPEEATLKNYKYNLYKIAGAFQAYINLDETINEERDYLAQKYINKELTYKEYLEELEKRFRDYDEIHKNLFSYMRLLFDDDGFLTSLRSDEND